MRDRVRDSRLDSARLVWNRRVIRALRNRKLFSDTGKTVERGIESVCRLENKRRGESNQNRRASSVQRERSNVANNERDERRVETGDCAGDEFENQLDRRAGHRIGGASLFLRRADQKRHDVFAPRQKRRSLLAARRTSGVAAAGKTARR